MHTVLLHWFTSVGIALGAPPPGLSMEAAVDETLRRHPALAASEHAVEAATARARQAETAVIPRISVEGHYRISGPVPTLSIDTGMTLPGQSAPIVIDRDIGSLHNAGASVQVGWRALDFGVRGAREDAAEAQTAAARSDGDARAVDLAYGVRGAYAGALFFADVVAVTEKALEVAQRDLADAHNKQAAGLGADLDIAAADSRVADLEARLVEARESHSRVLESLRILLGRAPGEPLELTDTLEALAARSGQPTDARVHPKLAALDHTEQALEDQGRAIDRGFWPTVDLFAQAGYQYPRTFVETDKAGFVWAAGASLKWDVFDGDLRSRQEEEVAARRAEVSELRHAADEDLARSTVEAEARARTARASVVSAERRRSAAETYLKVARGALSSGTGRALDVQSARVAVDQANLALARARFEAVQAEAARLQAAGVARADEGSER